MSLAAISERTYGSSKCPASAPPPPDRRLAASGIKGRVAWRGDLCAGVRIRAYHSVADIAAEKTVAISAPTKTDGNYQLELPPGATT